jgi:hypothetical protein
LGAPPGGVGGVDGDDRDALLRGHGNKPGPQAGGREPGDQAPELLTATVFLAGLPVGEVEVFQADRDRTALAGPVQEPGGGVPDLGVTMVRATGQVVGEAAGFADRVAVPVQAPGRVVVVVGVDADTAPADRRGRRT